MGLPDAHLSRLSRSLRRARRLTVVAVKTGLPVARLLNPEFGQFSVEEGACLNASWLFST
jgi:hypothetical protein